MCRRLGLRAKILLAGDDAAAEELGPGAVDLNARGERVGRAGEPAGQAEAVLWRAGLQRRQDSRRAGLDLFAGGEKITAPKNGRHSRLVQLAHDEGGRRRRSVEILLHLVQLGLKLFRSGPQANTVRAERILLILVALLWNNLDDAADIGRQFLPLGIVGGHFTLPGGEARRLVVDALLELSFDGLVAGGKLCTPGGGRGLG